MSNLSDVFKKPDPHKSDFIKACENPDQGSDVNIDIAKNIKLSELLRIEINKHCGVDQSELLEKCIRCISLMTGDKVFYNQNVKKIK